MTIVCKVCKYAIHSTKPENSQEDVMKKLWQHLSATHHEHATELSKLVTVFQGLAGSFLLFSYAEIPPTEPALLVSYHEAKQGLENILASEPIIGKMEAPIPSDRPVQ